MRTHFLFFVLACSGCNGSIVDVPGAPSWCDEPPTGEHRWTHVVDTPGGDFPRDVAIDASGNVIVVGAVQPEVDTQSNDAWVAVFDPSGELVWSETWDGGQGASEVANAVAVGADGFVVLGDLAHPESGGAILRAYDLDGEVRWTREIEGTVHDVAWGAGGALFASGALGEGAERHASLRRFGADGELAWEHVAEGGSGDPDLGYWDVHLDAEGRAYALFYSAATGAEVHAFDLDGTLRAVLAVDGNLLAVDGAGGIAMTIAGELVGGPVTLVRFDADLQEAWRVEDMPPGTDYLGVQGLAIDPCGAVLVSGFAMDAGSDRTVMFVRKYDTAGALVWSDEYAGPDDVFGYGFTVATGPAGQVATTGLVAADGLDSYAIAVRALAR